MDIDLLTKILELFLIAIQTIVVAIATFFATSQLKESVRTRKIDVIERVFEYISTSKIREARRNIYNLKLPLEIEKLTEQQKRDIEEILLGWGRVGFLFELGLFDKYDKEILFKTYSRGIDELWGRLKDYVEHDRRKFNYKEYWREIEYLADETRKWRISKDLPIYTKTRSIEDK